MITKWSLGDCVLWRGDCLKVINHLQDVDAVVSDPPYGMKNNTDSTRFTSGSIKRGRGRNDWGKVQGDDKPFDPEKWIKFPKVVLWGMNHFGKHLPVGTSLVWIKKKDEHFKTFLSDAELGWMKGGHGVYCFRKLFPPPSRMKENDGSTAHPCQKPIDLMRWCLDMAKTKEGDTILDPYMGSGTTGVACVQMGRKFIGIEKEDRYFQIAINRIRRAIKGS